MTRHRPLARPDLRAAMTRLEPVLRGTQHEVFFRSHAPRYGFVLRLLGAPPQPGARLLDVGASPGHVSALCLDLGWRPVAVDRFPDTPFPPKNGKPPLNLFRALGIPAVEMDITAGALPFGDASFSTVLFNETLEHLVGSPLPAVCEMARVLAPGGRLILTTPNAVSLRNRIAFLFGYNIYTRLETAILVKPYKCHNREYTLSEVCGLVRRAGLAPVRRGRANLGEAPPNGARALARIPYYALTWLWPPGRSLNYVIAEKQS